MNQLIPWLPQYDVNVSDIDRQHQELFRMMNELLDATWDGKGKEFIKDALKFLANYTVNHFATEEAYMRNFSYAGYIDHKRVHDELTAQVNEFVKSCEDQGVTTDTLVSVILGLGNWIKDHIRGMDQKLGRFLLAESAERGLALASSQQVGVSHP